MPELEFDADAMIQPFHNGDSSELGGALPLDFMADYVNPAIETWTADQSSKHLAVHVLTQLDVLAEVVVHWRAQRSGREIAKYEVGNYRDELGRREEALAVVRDAHDSHKHGVLNRATATKVSRGQRPQLITKHASFCGVTFCGGPPTPYQQLFLVLNDGREVPIYKLLRDAQAAWRREFERLGIG